MAKKMIENIEANFMAHVVNEENNFYISLWNGGSSNRKDAIEKIDYLTRVILAKREISQVNRFPKITEDELLTFQLYIIFKRYLFSTVAAFFRGYYDISLANARVAFEASIYAYVFYHDSSLKKEYVSKGRLRKLDKKFKKIYDEKKDFANPESLLKVYNLCSKRGSHCDYLMLQETIVKKGNEIFLALNDLLDDTSGEFNKKLFEIFRGFTTSLRVFNVVINSSDKEFF